MSEIERLIEMGFSQSLAEKALSSTGNRGLDAAMDWLIEHQGDTEVCMNSESDVKDEAATVSVRSYKCEDCQKCLRSEQEVQLHSARTAHVNFSESSDSVQPLTEEERKVQMEKLQNLLNERKVQREEQEKRNQIEQEKRRRQQGKDMKSAKEKYQEAEVKRMITERRRDQEEEKLLREKLRAEIAHDREERKRREQGISTPPIPESTKSATPVVVPSKSANHTACQLQIRLPSGEPLRQTFNPIEPLNAVILLISQRLGVEMEHISLMTTFPKREFTEEDRLKPLVELGLCPSAVVIAKQKPIIIN